MRSPADDATLARGYRPCVHDAERPARPGERIRPRDLVIAVGVAVVQLAVTAGPIARRAATANRHGCWWGTCPPHRGVDALAVALLALGPAALLLRRIHPRPVLAFVFAVTAVYAIVGYPAGPVFLSLIVAFATVVRRGDRWLGAATIVVGYVVFLWAPAVFGTGTAAGVPQAAGLAAWLLVLMFAAELARGRHERQLAQRRSHEETARRLAEEERLRIARELHDVLAHNISLINVQSGVALHLLEERPEQARTALSIINEASADALREMRSVLGVLRRVDETAPRRPAGGLDRLAELVERAGAAGVHVEPRVEGAPRALDAAVDLAAYRIVQESLTNVVRHAPGARAAVTVGYGPDAITIEVRDEGGELGMPAGAGTGNGIAGMRERATALGGALEAGPLPGGRGYRVWARLPDAAASPPSPLTARADA